MSQLDLANIKTRLIGCSAVMTVGQIISNVLTSTAAAGIPGGAIALPAVSILASIATGVAGNMAASDLANRMSDRLSKNHNILGNQDLTKAAGEAIGYLLREVAKSDELIAIAERNNLLYPEPAPNCFDRTQRFGAAKSGNSG